MSFTNHTISAGKPLGYLTEILKKDVINIPKNFQILGYNINSSECKSVLKYLAVTLLATIMCIGIAEIISRKYIKYRNQIDDVRGVLHLARVSPIYEAPEAIKGNSMRSTFDPEETLGVFQHLPHHMDGEHISGMPEQHKPGGDTSSSFMPEDIREGFKELPHHLDSDHINNASNQDELNDGWWSKTSIDQRKLTRTKNNVEHQAFVSRQPIDISELDEATYTELKQKFDSLYTYKLSILQFILFFLHPLDILQERRENKELHDILNQRS